MKKLKSKKERVSVIDTVKVLESKMSKKHSPKSIKSELIVKDYPNDNKCPTLAHNLDRKGQKATGRESRRPKKNITL